MFSEIFSTWIFPLISKNNKVNKLGEHQTYEGMALSKNFLILVFFVYFLNLYSKLVSLNT